MKIFISCQIERGGVQSQQDPGSFIGNTMSVRLLGQSIMIDWESATWKGRAVTIVSPIFPYDDPDRLFKNRRPTCNQFFASEPHFDQIEILRRFRLKLWNRE